jgi:hypothetical protein
MIMNTENTIGRPTDYQEDYVRQVEKLCALGAIDDDLADFFGVSVRTIYRWKAKHPDFCQALKVGKSPADDRVMRSLYHRATGMRLPAIKIFMPAGADEPIVYEYEEVLPPDVKACMSWLGNRCGWSINPRSLDGDDGVIPQSVRVEIIDGRNADTDSPAG